MRESLRFHFDNLMGKLEKILVAVNPVCFDNHRDIVVNFPTKNQDTINLFLAIKPFRRNSFSSHLQHSCERTNLFQKLAKIDYFIEIRFIQDAFFHSIYMD